MKVSIITVCFNSALTLRDTIDSVLSQDHKDIEYIIIDGGSTDGTTAIIQEYGLAITKWVSEPDRGIYDAMNKGIGMASGDVIGFLNSDDMYMNQSSISQLIHKMNEEHADCVFADLIYVDSKKINRVLRYYNSGHFKPSRFQFGWMPAHPTFLAKKTIYDRVGIFSLQYKIAADYELLIRILWKDRAKYAYLPKPVVKMRAGGISTAGLSHSLLLNQENVMACRAHGIKTNLVKILLKFPWKLFELARGRLLNDSHINKS